MAVPLCEIIPRELLFFYQKSIRWRGAVSVPLSVIIKNVGVTVAVPLFETICWESVDTQRSFWREGVTAAVPRSEIIRKVVGGYCSVSIICKHSLWLLFYQKKNQKGCRCGCSIIRNHSEVRCGFSVLGNWDGSPIT